MKLFVGPYAPDLPEFNGTPGQSAPRLVGGKNTIFQSGHYIEFPAPAVWGTSQSGACNGAVAFNDRDSNTRIYSGDSGGLYRYVNTTATDSSKAGGYNASAEEQWEFEKLGNTCIATNIDDDIQFISFGASAFADFASSSLKPRARHIGLVGPNATVMLGNVEESGVRYPNRLRWASITDNKDFDTSAANIADSDDLEGSGGWIQAVLSGQYGVILQETAIWRQEWVGSPRGYIAQRTQESVGCWAPYGSVRYGNSVFFISNDGFMELRFGSELVPIGNGAVDKTFYDDVNQTYIHRIKAALDPINHIVGWAYASKASSAGNIDKVLFYNWADRVWSPPLEESMEILFSSLSAGYTLDGLDSVSTSLDALEFGLDSPVWTGGNLLFSMFDTGHRLNNFNGSGKQARLDLCEYQLFESMRAQIGQTRPEIEGTTAVKISSGKRDRLGDTRSFSASVTMDANGLCSLDSESRYHLIRIDIDAGASFKVVGIDVEAAQTGQF